MGAILYCPGKPNLSVGSTFGFEGQAILPLATAFEALSGTGEEKPASLSSRMYQYHAPVRAHFSRHCEEDMEHFRLLNP